MFFAFYFAEAISKSNVRMVPRLLVLIAALSCSCTFVHCAAKECSCWHSFEDPMDKLAHVCGVNGQSYLDPCWAKCGGTVPAYYGNCTTKVKLGATCRKCSDAYDPVCGADGVNYHNPCFSGCTGTDIVSYGLCSKQKNPSKKCVCPTKGINSAPVCGNDGTSYGNQCYADCKGVTVVKGAGRCIFPTISCKSCNYTEYQPVCGEKGQEFNNLCFANCAKVKPVHFGNCLGVGRLITNNWMRWAAMSACGVDGKEYQNRCQAECQNAKIDSQVYSECGGNPKQF